MKNLAFLTLAILSTACSQPAPPTTAATSPAPAATAEAPIQAASTAAINTPRAKELLKQPGTQVLDVRTPAEYILGHLEPAKNLNVNSDDFTQQLTQLDTAKTYVVYCHSGKRSGKALGIMQQHGFRHLVNGGGYADLKE